MPTFKNKGFSIHYKLKGYQISAASLESGSFSLQGSTIRHLKNRVNVDDEILLRGTRSLGYLLGLQNLESVPSPTHLSPNGSPYFNGGYTVETHGSWHSGIIDAIQLELPSNYRFYNRTSNSQATAKAVLEYMSVNGILLVKNKADRSHLRYSLSLTTNKDIGLIRILKLFYHHITIFKS